MEPDPDPRAEHEGIPRPESVSSDRMTFASFHLTRRFRSYSEWVTDSCFSLADVDDALARELPWLDEDTLDDLTRTVHRDFRVWFSATFDSRIGESTVDEFEALVDAGDEPGAQRRLTAHASSDEQAVSGKLVELIRDAVARVESVRGVLDTAGRSDRFGRIRGSRCYSRRIYELPARLGRRISLHRQPLRLSPCPTGHAEHRHRSRQWPFPTHHCSRPEQALAGVPVGGRSARRRGSSAGDCH